jgi:hypothetical protein
VVMKKPLQPVADLVVHEIDEVDDSPVGREVDRQFVNEIPRRRSSRYLTTRNASRLRSISGPAPATSSMR